MPWASILLVPGLVAVAGLLRRAQAAYGRSSFGTTFAALGNLNLDAERSALLYR